MTVKELIEKLKECDQEADVYRHDSEWDDVPAREVEKTAGMICIF